MIVDSFCFFQWKVEVDCCFHRILHHFNFLVSLAVYFKQEDVNGFEYNIVAYRVSVFPL